MYQIFHESKNFAANISTWNTSKVEDMTFAFADTEHFTADVSTWDVSSVTTMESIFHRSKNFGSDVTAWDTSNVIDFTYAFNDASGFNKNNKKTLCWDLTGAARGALSQFSCDSTQGGLDCSCSYFNTSAGNYAGDDDEEYGYYTSLSEIINSDCPKPTPSCIDRSNSEPNTRMKFGLFSSLVGSYLVWKLFS